MALRFHRSVLLGEIEVACGGDPTPTGADAIRALESGPLEILYTGTQIDKSYYDKTLGNHQQGYALPMGTCNFRTMFATNGDAATGSLATYLETEDLFQALGFTVAATAETGGGVDDGYITILPSSLAASMKCITFYLYRDGLLKKLTSAVCESASIHLPAGDYPYIDWTFKGIYNAPTDVALATPTYDAGESQMVQSSAYTLNVVGLKTTEVVININNGVTMDKSVNSAYGIDDFLVMTRDVNGTLDAEAELVATYPFHTEWITSLERAFTFTIAAADVDNKIVITMPKLQIGDIGEENRDGKYMFNLPYKANMNAGDDELSIIMGA